MKLDVTVMKSMTSQDYRVLSAVEYGMKSHELVPVQLIVSLAKLRHGGTHKILSSLLRDQLLSHDQSCGYDGYRVTNAGQDILALHSLKVSRHVHALGRKIGTGKESDVYLAIASSSHKDIHSSSDTTTHSRKSHRTQQQQQQVVAEDEEGIQVVAKFHRLGRTSFRNVKKKRDYFFIHNNSKNHSGSTNTTPHSWLFLSTLSAKKEFSFMQALHNVGLPTPTPIGYNRHVVVMSLIRGMPLYQIIPKMISSSQAKSIFTQAIHMTIQLLSHGLIHCDLNEFNLLVDLSGIQDQIANGEFIEQHENDEEEEGDERNNHPTMDIVSLSSISKSRHTTSNTTYTNKSKRRNNTLHSSSSIGEYYVRHSGKSKAGKGALSIHTPIVGHETMDGTGERVTETLPTPKYILNEQGEAKPTVTLIDFPQMISINHPNAKELFQRDVDGLRRFFGTKLNCPSMTLQEYLKEREEEEEKIQDVEKNDIQNPELLNASSTTTTTTTAEKTSTQQDEKSLDDAVIIPTWDDLVIEGIKGEMLYRPSRDVISILKLSNRISNTTDSTDDDDDNDKITQDMEDEEDGSMAAQTLSRVAKKQLRIDQLLKVSGYSQDDAARDSELYYFENSIMNDIQEEEEEDNSDKSVNDIVEIKDNHIHQVEAPTRLKGDETDRLTVPNDEDDSKMRFTEADDEGSEGDEEEEGEDEDNLSKCFSTMTLEKRQALKAAEIEAIAKLRVMRYVQNVKKKEMRKGAFGSRNSNKIFVKGKRIYHEYGTD